MFNPVPSSVQELFGLDKSIIWSFQVAQGLSVSRTHTSSRRHETKPWKQTEIAMRMKSIAASWQQQTHHFPGHLEKGHFNRKQRWVLNQNIFFFCLFTQKTVSRFIFNHSDPPGTCRDHSCFDVTYGNKRVDRWECATARQRHRSFSTSLGKKSTPAQAGEWVGNISNETPALAAKILCWDTQVMTNVSAWGDGEKHTCAA